MKKKITKKKVKRDFGEMLESIKRIGDPKDFPKNWGKMKSIKKSNGHKVKPNIHSRNKKSLDSFTAYCREFPMQRFFQALRNWSGSPFILTASGYDCDKRTYTGIGDTFYEEDFYEED